MTEFENPVLKYELKVRVRPSRLVPAMLLRCACLGLIFLLVLLSRLGRGLLAFTLAEALLIMFFTPGAVCNSFASNAGRADLGELALTRLSSASIFLGKLGAADLYTFIVIVLSALATFVASFFHEGLYIWRLVFVNAVLMVLVFASAVIGLASSMLFRRNACGGRTPPAFPQFLALGDPRSAGAEIGAYMLAYALILLLIGSIVVPGPLIERIQDTRMKDFMIKVSLYANPLVMTSRSLGNMDIMRSRYMYTLADPIVAPGFTYPNWYYAGVIYMGMSCLLLVPAFIRFRRLVLSPIQHSVPLAIDESV